MEIKLLMENILFLFKLYLYNFMVKLIKIVSKI